LIALIESTRDLMIGSGRLTEGELRHHMAALVKHLADPATTLIDRLVVQAWGQNQIDFCPTPTLRPMGRPNVRYWHKADMLIAAGYVRFWG
jgi:hypothetical protein